LKTLSILGSTGSIGRQALDLVLEFPGRFRVAGLAAGKNTALLAEQIGIFRPDLAAVADEGDAERLSLLVGGLPTKIVSGEKGLSEVAGGTGADIIISAITGVAGFLPTLAAVKSGATVALANKESLVAGGEVICAEADRTGTRLLPVDSEHSAIFQSMLGHNRGDIRRLILTASGGPFAGMTGERLSRVTPAEALNHPRWRMGPKVTIDSATLMNKGFEVIEARWLFDIPVGMIEILIHRQSSIHSMVEYTDGSVVAQMGIADMRIPIAYALSYPDRLPLDLPPLDLCTTGPLTFEKPDPVMFPAYKLAYEAAGTGGTAPAALCAADEAAVGAFLDGRLPFTGIPALIRAILEDHKTVRADTPAAVLEAVRTAREKAEIFLTTRSFP
jgi:1-deoxy-D-xylulose-5-phosphate reductoisomerase